MLTYEQQTDKLLKKRKTLEKRMREDSAEIEKINAKLSEMQLAKVREAFGLSEKDFFELITQHPEKLLELTVQNGAAVSEKHNAQHNAHDDAVLDGQTSLY